MRWLGGCALLCVGVWWLFLRPVTPLDFNVFAAAGKDVLHGRDPYPALNDPFLWSGSAFVYPWLAAWIFTPLSGLSLHAAAILWSAVSFAAVAGGVYVLVGPRLDVFAWILLAAPTLDGLQMGTINALLFFVVCVAWRWRDSAVIGGIAVGLLVVLKVFLWPLGIWLLLTRRWWTAAWAAGSGVALLVIGWLAGSIGPHTYLRLLNELSTHEVHQAAGLQGELVRAGFGLRPAEVIGVVLGLLVLFVAARRSDRLGYGAAIVAALLASPVVWHHYYLLLAAPLLLARYGAPFYFVLGWLSVSARTTYGIAWWPVTLGVAVLVGIAAGWFAWRHRCVIAAWWRGMPRRQLAAVGLAAVLIAVLVALTAAHDRLGAVGDSAVPVLGSLAVLLLLALTENNQPRAN
jgi:hypothetical protein